MATEWYLMQKTTLGGYEEAELDWQKQTFENDVLGSSLAQDVLLYEDKITNEPTQIRALIQDMEADSQGKSNMRTVLCMAGTIDCGYYLYFKNSWWMVISLVDHNAVYEKGVLQYCNYTIRFVVPGTEQTVEYPVPTINSTQYNSGEELRRQMVNVSSQRIMYLPNNEETIYVDNDFRLLMDMNRQKPTAWKVTQVDAESYAFSSRGLVRWTVLEDRLRDTDDVENMLADNQRFDELQTTTPVPNAEGWGL
jgi:hypothetical protein